MNEGKLPNWFDNVEWRPHPWPGLNWLTAMLYVPSCQDAIKFYEKAFGFVTIFELPDGSGNPVFARMRYRGNNFTVSKEGSSGYEAYKSPITCKASPHATFYLYVDDVDRAVPDAVSYGGKLLQQPELQFWGDKKGTIEDPFGYVWELATRLIHLK